MKKTFFVFWTFEANYQCHPFRAVAENFVEAIKQASMYDPYKANEQGKRMRFIVFEEGSTLVWDGECPEIGDEPGKVVVLNKIETQGRILVFREAKDRHTLMEREVEPVCKLPNVLSPSYNVKYALAVGDGLGRAVYLCNKTPDGNDLVFRAK